MGFKKLRRHHLEVIYDRVQLKAHLGHLITYPIFGRNIAGGYDLSVLWPRLIGCYDDTVIVIIIWDVTSPSLARLEG